MTQLIGAVCDNGRKLIFLADRRVERAGLAFDRGVKGEPISDNAMALTAGTVHEPELLEEVKKELKNVSKPRIVDIAKKISKKYQDIRIERIKDEVLRQMGFESLNDYYDKQKILHDSMVIDLNSKIEQYDLGLYLLLGGVDERAHLYRITNPGVYASFDAIGFLCPGMGQEQAESTFVWYDYSPLLTETEALYIAFEAKKKAETAGGIGETTDAWLIGEGGIYEVKQETITGLNEIYCQRQNSVGRGKFGEQIKEFQIAKKKVEY